MRTHMDVKEGYRPWRPTVKASDAAPGRGPNWRSARGRPVERYAPGMGYPGDEGGGPPDSRLDTREGAAVGRDRWTRTRPAGEYAQRQPPPPGRRFSPGHHGLSPGHHGVPRHHGLRGRPGLPGARPGHGAVRARGAPTGRRARDRAAGTRPGRGQRARPRRLPGGPGPARRRSLLARERLAPPGPAARAGDPGRTRKRSRQGRITVPRIVVERRGVPHRGAGRARPGPRIPARTRSARPCLPARPVLALERTRAPHRRCRGAAGAGRRVRP